MTIRELTEILVRRWFVVVLALAVAAAGGFLLQRQAGVYTTQTVISFLLPEQTSLSPDSGLEDDSVIAFAGAVARQVDAGEHTPRYSTDEAPLYGAGVRQGVVVSLPNGGSQFVSSFQRAEIVLEIVGPSERWVQQEQLRVLDRISDTAASLQSTVTRTQSRIQVAPVPLTQRIQHISPSRTEQLAAYLALGLAGLIVGGWGAVVVDRAVRRREQNLTPRAPGSGSIGGPEA